MRIEVRSPLHAAAARLMASLGVEVTVSAQQAFVTRDCAQPGCPNAATDGEHCSLHVAAQASRRPVLARQARALRDRGMTWLQIAAELGISRSYAADLYHDPTGIKARARKDSYAVPCPGCGNPMGGTEGKTVLPDRCAACAHKGQHDERYWTRDTIVEAFLAFHSATGRNPTATETFRNSPTMLAKLSDTRLAEMEAAAGLRLPHPGVVQREFGSWAAAVAAAGLTANRTGGAAHRERGTSGYSRKRGRQIVARQFIILQPDNGGYRKVGAVEAATPGQAIEQVADQAGRYIAVAAPHWHELTVAPVTRLAIVAPEAVS